MVQISAEIIDAPEPHKITMRRAHTQRTREMPLDIINAPALRLVGHQQECMNISYFYTKLPCYSNIKFYITENS